MSKVNLEWFDKTVEWVEQENQCQLLNEKLQLVQDALAEQIESLDKQLELKSLLEDLLTIPSSVDGVLGYLNKIKNLVVKYYLPLIDTIETYAEMVQKYTELITTIINKISTLQCNIETPDLPEAPTLPDPLDI